MPRYPSSIEELIKERNKLYDDSIEIELVNSIPSNDSGFPLYDKWLKIDGVICIFVDLRNSTILSANTHDRSTAKIYEYFTGSAVRLFHMLKCDYLDIKGDGVFVLFNKNRIYEAFASAITFKTFATFDFLPKIKQKLPTGFDIGFHIGIDQETVLVKQIGLKDNDGRDKRKNEVWAGKPINMAAKLASLSKNNELYISDRFFDKLKKCEFVCKSCGCSNGVGGGDKKELWQKVDLSDDSKFDFDQAFFLESFWCEEHGLEYSQKIISFDQKK